MPRSIPLKQESVTIVDLHVFGDASALGCCAAAYVIVYQPSSVNQGLIASKSRPFKKRYDHTQARTYCCTYGNKFSS